MVDSKETLLLRQLRSLLDQLEAAQQQRKSSQSADRTMQEEISMRLLKISCLNCWEYDPLSNMVHIYDHFEEVKSHSLSTLMARMKNEDKREVFATLQRILHQECEEESFTYYCNNGDTTRYYDLKACCYQNGLKTKVIGITTNIYEKEDYTEELQEQQKYEILRSLSNMYIWEYDVAKQVFSANEALCEKLNLENKSYTADELSTCIQIPQLSRLFDHILKKCLTEHSVVHVKFLENSYELIFETNFKAVTDSQGNYLMILGTMNDITERELLKTSASRDSLTGCFNRRSADMTLISTFQKFKDQEEFYTIIFFDIDMFKKVNDSYGHDVGDYVLKHVCELIQREIRSSDMLFRWGGDEFLLICSGISKENIYAYIERLRRRVEASMFEFNKERFQITISIGAAYYYHSDCDFQQAMKRADRSLYKCKLAGRNKVCILK